ncbi:MAG: nitronate monooxygenase family protein [Syntrophobacteraceae bacterium]
MWVTRATKLLGTEFPIIGGAMQWISRAPFVAAVSNAGGLGIITSATFSSKKELKEEIRRTRDLTDRPFAVNVNLFPSMRPMSVEEMIDAVGEEGVGIVETSGHNPAKYVESLKNNGRIYMHKCAREHDAVKAEALGVDLVTIVGTECGGHPSAEGITTMVLLPRTVRSVSVPVVGGGGFCDGRGLMAALSLGAEGIVMGTALMATEECPIHPNFKRALLEAEVSSTCLLLMSVKAPIRVFVNKPATEVLDMEVRCEPLEKMLPKMRGELGRQALETGELDGGIWACGQIAGLVKKIMPVRDFFQSVMEEAESIRRQWGIVTQPEADSESVKVSGA